MLETFRRNASSWLVKGLFLVLALSFVLWGVPQDFLGGGQPPLATVGSTPISAQEFQKAYQTQLSAISRQSGERLTAEQARLFGLDQNVLNRLINSAALENQAKTLGLALSDAALGEGVANDPEFQGTDGKFSREGFTGLLRQIGMSEQGFLALRRKEELVKQLAGALANGLAVPEPLAILTHGYREETRSIAHLTIDADRSVKAAEPDAAKLQETYEQNKAQFMTPEYRHLAVLLLRRDSVRDRAPVSEEEIRAAYEQDKETFDEPERRRVQQIAFKDAGAAAEAKKAIDGGKPFTDVAKDQGATLADIELGLLSKKQLIDPKIALAAFSIEKDKVSDVIEGRFATVLLRVSEIQPGKQKTLDDVKEQLRERLFKEKAKGAIQELNDEVEDARVAGKPLKDIAETKKLTFIDVPAASRANKSPDGRRALDIEEADAVMIVKAGFGAAIGVETESIPLPDGGYAWVDPLSRTEPALKPFDDVKAEVATLAAGAERERLLSELGAKLVDRVTAGETLEALAKEFGGAPQTASAVKRGATVAGLTDAAVKQAFGTPAGGAGSASSEGGKSRTIFKVEAVKPADPLTPEQGDALAKELREQLRNDAIASYLGALKSRQAVHVNEAALRRATGADAPQ